MYVVQHSKKIVSRPTNVGVENISIIVDRLLDILVIYYGQFK